MQVQSGKKFIIIALVTVLILGGLNWLFGHSRQSGDVPASSAQTQNVAQQSANNAEQQPAAQQSEVDQARLTELEEAYRAGYRDGRQDAEQAPTVTRTRYVRRSYARSGVAGVRYERRRSGGGWKEALLTIGAPAAIGAGVGALAGGKKGAGVGALLGGGGGALYYLVKSKRRR